MGEVGDLLSPSEQKNALELARNAGVAGFGSLTLRALGPVLAVVISRVLGAEIYGAYVLAVTVVGVVAAFSVLGLDQGVLRYIAYYHSREDVPRAKGVLLSSMGIVLGVSVIASLALFGASPVIATVVFRDAQVSVALKILALSLPISAVSLIMESGLQSLRAIDWHAAINQIGRPLIELALVGVALAIGFGFFGVLAARVVAVLTVACLNGLALSRLLSFYRGVAPIYETRELASFSSPLFLDAVLLLVLGSIDILILGYFRDSSLVGIYKAVTLVVTPVVMPLLAFRIGRITRVLLRYSNSGQDGPLRSVSRFSFPSY
jgi:O-antigen/teichoic acid export membrane protein